MELTAILSNIFDLNNIQYDYIEQKIPEQDSQNTATVDLNALSNLASITLLKSPESLIFAIFPDKHHINLAKLVKSLNQPIHYLDVSHIQQFQERCDELDFTQIMSSYKIHVVIDIEVSDLSTVLFKNGNDHHYLEVNSQNLEKLIVNSPIGCQFSEPKPEYNQPSNLKLGTPRLDLTTKINTIKTLPILPEIAAQILQLQNNPNASVDSLADIVNMDPALTSLILRYSNSALFGQRGSVDSIYDAILRVLGFDTVLYLAIGLALGNSFKLDKKGPLGSRSIWQHAVYSAAICQKLSQHCPKEFRPSPGQAYLAGLLHDIGYLVLANSFETEYFWLNKLINSKPDVPMTLIEHQLLGVQHTDLGKILLQNWNMPEFLMVAVSEHHNEDYLGQFCAISGLVLIVDRVLKMHGQSDASSELLPEELVSRLGLSNNIIFDCVNEVLKCSDSLDLMVSAMSA